MKILKDEIEKKVFTMLIQIIDAERTVPVDWYYVNNLAESLLNYLNNNFMFDLIDRYIIKYLDDIEIHEQNYNYGEYQRQYLEKIFSEKFKEYRGF